MVIVKNIQRALKHWFTGEVSQEGYKNPAAPPVVQFYPIGWNGYDWNERNFEEFVRMGYGKNPYVFMVVDKIAATIAALPYVLKNSKGEVIEAPSDLKAILTNPNNIDNFYELLYRIVSSYEVTGNSYVYETTPIGFSRPSDISCAITQDVTIMTKNGLQYREPVSYQIQYVGNLLPSRVLHIKRPNILNNTAYGLSSLHAGQPVYTASNNTFEAAASIHKNQGASGVISPKDSNMPVMPAERQEMQNQFNAVASGASKTGMRYVSTVGVNYTAIGMNATDLKLIEFNIEHLRSTCSLFGLSSALFNDPANKTYNNEKEAKLSFYEDKVLPLAANIIGQLSDWLIKGKFGIDAYLDIDTDKIKALHEDVNSKHKRVNEDVKAGILTAQEARSMLYPELPPMQSQNQIDGNSNELDAPKAQSANELAQANLRGSVGGVQGILQIQQSFVAGITSESSAVSILMEIYGFDNATARQILGL